MNEKEKTMSDLPNSQNREQAAEPGSPAAKQQAPQPGPHNGTQLPAQSGLGDGAVCYAKAFWEPFAKIQSTIMDILALILLNFGFGIIIAIVAFIGVFIMAKSFFVAVLFFIAAGIPLTLLIMACNSDSLTRTAKALNEGTRLPSFTEALIPARIQDSLKVAGCWVLILVGFTIAAAIVIGIGFSIHEILGLLIALVLYLAFACFYVPFTVFSAAEAITEGVPAVDACKNAGNLIMQNLGKVVIAYLAALGIALLVFGVSAVFGKIAYIGGILAYLLGVLNLIAQFSGWTAVRNLLKK